ncbi:MAG TPA: LacI family DNA-binding transcriptional regulator [Opitutaceae bacterium]|jgi:LacI family transcriptional regulator
MTPRVTLRDVAARAAVHVSTVSLALRNSPRLPRTTVERVQAVAKEMGYVHDSMLDALMEYRDSARRRSSPPVLGYVTSWAMPIEEIPHHRFYWSGAKARAEELGFRLERFSLAEPGMTDVRLGDILLARGITGVVLSSFERGSAEVRFDWDRMSAVRIELQPVWPPLSTTAVDHVRAIEQAMCRAAELGYRRPGFMLGHDWSELVENRWRMGFLWAQQRLPASRRLPAFTFNADWKHTPRQFRFKSWFLGHRPDVILGPHFHVEARLADVGARVPADVAVIDPFLETPHDFYAGVLHDFEEVGARAVEKLAVLVTRNVRGIPADMVRSYVDGFWHDGPSCPRAPEAARRGAAHSTV